jgi:hypothetical protein
MKVNIYLVDTTQIYIMKFQLNTFTDKDCRCNDVVSFMYKLSVIQLYYDGQLFQKYKMKLYTRVIEQ